MDERELILPHFLTIIKKWGNQYIRIVFGTLRFCMNVFEFLIFNEARKSVHAIFVHQA